MNSRSAAFAAQRRAQRALPPTGEREKLLFGHAEQRALQHARQREIVVGQQQRIGERHQVHHGDVLGEHQPVGARDLDALLLQRADDRLEQRAALAHQHQNVARPAPRGPRRRTRAPRSSASPCGRSAARAARAGSSPASRRTARPSLRSRASRPARSSATARRRPARSRAPPRARSRPAPRSAPRWACARLNTVSTACSTAGAERNEY